MPARFFRQSAFWSLTIAYVSLLSPEAHAEQPGKTFSEEHVFMALIEPNLDAQGRLSGERRQHILNAGRKMLTGPQMKALEIKLAKYQGESVLPDSLSHSAQAAIPSNLPPTVEGPYLMPKGPPAAPAVQPKPVQAPAVEPPSEVVWISSAPEWLFGPRGYAYPSWQSDQRSAWSMFDTLSVYIGLDGSKGPEDLGVNANMGGRSHVNWGVPLWEEVGLGLQIGTGVNYYNNAVSVLETVDGKQDRFQSFSTLGIFQRTNWGLNWGVCWDYLAERYWADFSLSQWRGQVGYELNGNNEIGIWGTIGDSSANVSLGGSNYHLRPITQGNLFWKHIWPNESITRFWVGLASEHNQYVLVNPGKQQTNNPFVYGADVYIPLNNWVSLYGQANFITPAATGTVTATFGLAFNLGGRAIDYSRNRFAPLQSVANNPTFAVDLAPR